MQHPFSSERCAAILFAALTLLLGVLLAGRTEAQGAPAGLWVRLPGHLRSPALIAGQVGWMPAQQPIRLALTLSLRNQADLMDLLHRLYDPADPAYGQYLTPDQFTEQFGPTQAQYRAVEQFALAQGLTVVKTHPNRLLLDVEAPTAVVERAFSTRLRLYRSTTGRVFHAPTLEPAIPAALAGVLTGVVGLDDLAVRVPHSIFLPAGPRGARQIGSGPKGGLSPSDIKAAYGLSGLSLDGSGQSLGLFELDGYKPSDITGYEDQFGLPHVPLQNVLVDSASGKAGSGDSEVTLDIELMAALAPGAVKIVVYEGPNTDAGALDTYNRIATDNVAKTVSTSWGLPELLNTQHDNDTENAIYQQMAAQGQSMFAASGDSGAFDDEKTLSVDDPAVQPFVTGCGGTSLRTNGPGGTWVSESTWNGGSITNGGSGGGISKVWPIPSYQIGAITAASEGSTTMRNGPDVALDADPATGYAILTDGNWYLTGGTSADAPLWAAFTALVNQSRAQAGKTTAGFLNPVLYQLGKSSRYTADFHDIADGSTNLHYPAVQGHDDATGWGTINGTNLLNDLVTPPSSGGTQTFSISGTVTRATGGGLAGVTVSAGGQTTTTNASGDYTLTNVPAGTQTVSVSLAGYSFSPPSQGVNVNTALTGIDFTASQQTYSISGTITLTGGVGVSGVTVTGGGRTTTTDSAGSYTLTGLAPGSVTVTPSRPDLTFTPTTRTVPVTTADVGGVNFTATGKLSISGTIMQDGTGVSGVTVQAISTQLVQTCVSGTGGHYTISGRVAGTYIVSPTSAGLVFTPVQTTVTLTTSSVSGVDFQATIRFSISGRVQTARHQPFPGVTMTATPVTKASVSRSGTGGAIPDNTPGGITRAVMVPVGGEVASAQVTVNIHHPNRGDLQVLLIAPDGTAVTLYDGPRSDPSVNLQGTYPTTLAPAQSLSILDGRPAYGKWKLRVADLAPKHVGTLVSWKLTLNVNAGTPQTAVTDALGEYVISRLDPGPYVVKASFSGTGFTPPKKKVKIVASNVRNVGFTSTSKNARAGEFGLRLAGRAGAGAGFGYNETAGRKPS